VADMAGTVTGGSPAMGLNVTSGQSHGGSW